MMDTCSSEFVIIYIACLLRFFPQYLPVDERILEKEKLISKKFINTLLKKNCNENVKREAVRTNTHKVVRLLDEKFSIFHVVVVS